MLYYSIFMNIYDYFSRFIIFLSMCIYMREVSAIECGFSCKSEVDIRSHGVGVTGICGSPFVGTRKQSAVS